MKSKTLAAALLVALSGAVAVPAKAQDDKPYKVAEGNKVDAGTLAGWRLWRSQACERCHGPNQEGAVGPSLIESLKVLNKDEFKTVLFKGRIEKGMPNFDGSEPIQKGWEGLYGYLKGRSDGAIKPGRVQPLEGS
jgi:mono/diheme cytochrome c family protein